MTQKRAVVTGGAGFIGTHLVTQLAEAGHDVLVVDPKAGADMFPDGVRIENFSILERNRLQQVLDGAQWVFHQAAIAHLWWPDRKAYDQVNREGTAAVLAAARECGCERLIVTSTEAILRDWRDRSSRPLTEHEPTPPLKAMPGPYCRSKWQADRLARQAAEDGLDVVSLYPTVPVGKGDRWKTAPTRMLETFLLNTPPVFLPTSLNLVPVESVAEAHVLAAGKAAAGDRFIIGGRDVQLSTLLEWLERKTGRPMPKRRIPYVLAQLVGTVSEGMARLTGMAPQAPLEGVRLARRHWSVDSSYAKEVLDWHPGEVSKAVMDAVDELMT
jgi:dihydroflavonol-4-reductase